MGECVWARLASSCERAARSFFPPACVSGFFCALVVLFFWFSGGKRVFCASEVGCSCLKLRMCYQVFNFIKHSLRPKAIVLKLDRKRMRITTRGVKSVCAAALGVSEALLANSVSTLME